ncbi:MAG: tetraacyldisaccharide 4'-kinase [Azospirillaceae bacterium]
MRAPRFWTARPGLAGALLAPASAVWTWRTRRRLARPPTLRPPVPVVCVGNLTAGGSGKTPVALAIGRSLAEAGIAVGYLTRGHGGRTRGPVTVDPARHDARTVGDEPLLLAAVAPTVVARDRAEGARMAIARGARALVMDDGFQNPGLAKDLSILVFDGETGFGNGRVIPAGPLREPPADGLARADAVVMLGEDRTGLGAALDGRDFGRGPLPVLRARVEPPAEEAARWRDRDVVAFAGIGRPEKLFASLEAAGARLVARVAFPDHHAYQPDELMRLLEMAAAAGAIPVTTAKDRVRLPAGVREAVAELPVAVVWEEPAALDRLLAPVRLAAHGLDETV